MHHHIKTSFSHVVKWLGYGQNLGLHKPVIGAAKTAYKAAMHPLTHKVARAGVNIGVGAVRAGYTLVTHPTTANITHKLWLHGSKAAKHTSQFMVKVALKGFKLRRG
jgi:hypothetical protein